MWKCSLIVSFLSAIYEYRPVRLVPFVLFLLHPWFQTAILEVNISLAIRSCPNLGELSSPYLRWYQPVLLKYLKKTWIIIALSFPENKIAHIETNTMQPSRKNSNYLPFKHKLPFSHASRMKQIQIDLLLQKRLFEDLYCFLLICLTVILRQ